MDKHYPYLLQALALAAAERGHCAPNPAVGAVVVVNEEVISTGAHKGPGLPHAEVNALEGVNDELLQQATLYITLEPCCHHGRTPPCTDLIKAKKIKKVIYAFADPNPQVAGKGQAQLQAAGIDCQQVAHPDIDAFYQSYAYWTQHKRPRVTVKLAMSLNAKIADKNGVPTQLTGSEFQTWVHQQRLQHDGILTTVNTVNHDNPQLNVRLEKQTIAKPVAVLDTQLTLNQDIQLLQTARELHLLHAINADKVKQQFWQEQEIQCHAVASTSQGLNLNAVLDVLGELGWHDVWVEAGGTLFSALIQQQLAHRVYLAIAPRTLGAEALDAFPGLEQDWLADFGEPVWHEFGDDVLLEMSLYAIMHQF